MSGPVSAQDFFDTDEQLKSVDRAKYSTLASDEALARFTASAEAKKVSIICLVVTYHCSILFSLLPTKRKLLLN
jgi:hypothetical protein